MGGLTEAPVSAFYVDFARLLAMGEDAVAAFAEPDVQEQVAQMIDATGLRGLGQLGATSGFSGEMFETRAFLGISGRGGFLRLLPDGPLDAETLAAIPASSTMVSAAQVDLGALTEVLRDIAGEIEPGLQVQIDQFFDQLNEAAGADVEADVLAQFGTTWAGYVSPQIGSGIFSGVVINRPKDPAKLRESLGNVSRNLVTMANEHVARETDGDITIPGRIAEVDGQTLYILNLPGFAPTWSIDGEAGLLRVGAYPQTILSARAIGGDSFVESDRWKAILAQLEPGGEVAGLQFSDLPALAPDSYPLLLLGSQVAFGAADLFSEKLGTQPPVIVLPPLATMMEHIHPSGAVSWVAEDGVHYRSLEPFPGSNVLTMDWQSFAAQQYSTLVSVLLPSLNRAREAANRVKSGSNLRQIGQGMRQMAIDDVRGGKYPADLEALFLGVPSLPMEVFISPRSDTQPPEMMAQAREVQAAWVAENSDYLYLGGGLTDTAPATVMVAYEDPEKTGWNEGINVLYADGSVRFILLPMLDEEIRRHAEYREQKNLPIPPVLQE
jgi:prepilin-type processing-associated H-X9-DG protein